MTTSEIPTYDNRIRHLNVQIGAWQDMADYFIERIAGATHERDSYIQLRDEALGAAAFSNVVQIPLPPVGEVIA